MSVPSEALYVSSDAARLTQVIDNLVANACKFTDAGGHIGVTVERDGSEVVIRVKDDGIGIKAKKLPRVFDMFMQVEPSRGRSESGLGIGLTAESLAMLLRLDGHSLEAAYTGLEGLRVAEQMRPDVVILDIGMPGMDGYEVARQLRAEPWGGGILVIGLSGWSRDDDRQRSADAGIDVNMAKPADHDTLAAVIEAGAPHARASAAPSADSPPRP